MDVFSIYQPIVAAQQERAIPRASLRHRHLPEHPLVVVGYHAAGAPGDVLGLVYGTNRSGPSAVLMPNPRDIDMRFRRLETFADDVIAHLEPLTARVSRDLCEDAPVVLCPNQATCEWLTSTLGRALRYRRTDGEFAVPPSVPVLGAHLSFLASRRIMPGSSVVLAATDLLRSHWWVGQTDAESENLATLLAWIDPPDGLGPYAAAERAEDEVPAAGPVPDPDWERRVADELDAIREGKGNEAVVEKMIRDRLLPAWENAWRTHELLLRLPAAPSVDGRWSDDRRAWARHVERVADNQAWFRRVPTPRQGAAMLGMAESLGAQLEAQMAYDDPLVMAGLIAAGEALEGEVETLDLSRREAGRKQRVYRPSITVRPLEPFVKPAGTKLWWSARPKLAVEVLEVLPDGCVVLKACGGFGRGAPLPTSLPPVGDRAVFGPFEPASWYPNTLPASVPWTHTLRVEEDE